MYTEFFGFREKPFRLVPNPAYLFLSRGHEETLAHLAYAVSQDEGFVEITGEVGTGKTTLCRVFLDNLDENTEAAYIFNPKLDALQLLKTINDEFGVDSRSDNPKDLIDALNRFLLARAGEGKHVLLLIDEAQNLSREVLEQIRLLSNLETSTRKLLQIILVGQPELHETLHAHDLRQLGQRISVMSHLEPLSPGETEAYIHHRIRIASRDPNIVFRPGAARAVHRYAGGVPRLINMACDRALLTAFVRGQREITEAIVKESIRETAPGGPAPRPGPARRWRAGLVWILSAVFLAAALLLIADRLPLRVKSIIGKTGEAPSSSSPKPSDPAPPNAREEAEGVAPREEAERVAPRERAGRSLAAFLEGIDAPGSRRPAAEAVVKRWAPDAGAAPPPGNGEDVHGYFQKTVNQAGLLLYVIKNDFDLMMKLNLPGMVEMRAGPDASPAHLALLALTDGKLVLTAGENGISRETTLSEFKFHWTGRAYIPWRNFYEISGTVTTGASGEDVQKLKRLLGEVGMGEIESGPVYDEAVRDRIRWFQKKRDIKDDGIVGALTKMILYNANESLPIPRMGSDNWSPGKASD
ncbi:MAG: AAA family ATPase [Desulfobacterales bacterium]|nr:AAA family ATPase [Desulfobacterales bacterium]